MPALALQRRGGAIELGLLRGKLLLDLGPPALERGDLPDQGVDLGVLLLDRGGDGAASLLDPIEPGLAAVELALQVLRRGDAAQSHEQEKSREERSRRAPAGLRGPGGSV